MMTFSNTYVQSGTPPLTNLSGWRAGVDEEVRSNCVIKPAFFFLTVHPMDLKL